MISSIISIYLLSLISIFGTINISNAKAADIDIRSVDFKNATYHAIYCYDQFKNDGLDKYITVHNGEYKTDNGLVYFNIGMPFIYDKPSVLYGDLMANGHDQAIVAAECGSFRCKLFSKRSICLHNE